MRQLRKVLTRGGAGIAIILWIGIIICAQAYEVVPKRYVPAVVVGTLPGHASWAGLTIKSTLRRSATLNPPTTGADPMVGTEVTAHRR